MQEPILEQQAQFNRLYKEAEELYHSVAVRFGLSDASSLILYALSDSRRPCSQKELCEVWSMTKTTVNSALNSLIKAGHVALAPSPDNHRVKLASLTKSGKALAKKYALPLMEAERVAFERLSETERDLLTSLSKKHLDLLREEINSFFSD